MRQGARRGGGAGRAADAGSWKPLLLAAALASVFVLAMVAAPREAAVEVIPLGGTALGGGVPVDVYVMSMCPDAERCVRDLYDTLRDLGARVAPELHFLGAVNADNTVSCKHGDAECETNRVLLCAQAQVAETRALAFARCFFDDLQTARERLPACAAEAGVDYGAVRQCADGEHGEALMLASARRAFARGIVRSCHIEVDGEYFCELDGFKYRRNDPCAVAASGAAALRELLEKK